MKPNYPNSSSQLTNTAPAPLNSQLSAISGGNSAVQMLGTEVKPNSRNSINRNAQNITHKSDHNMNKT